MNFPDATHLKLYETPSLTVHGNVVVVTRSVGMISKVPDNPKGPQNIKTF